MNCPNCGKKPVRLMGTLFVKGVGFKKAMKGFFRCRYCDTLLIQENNKSGMPKYEKPFWYTYPLFLVVLLALIWRAYFDSNVRSEPVWFTITVTIVAFVLLFLIMEWIKVRYWIIRETTFDEHEKALESQNISTKGIVAFCLFAIAAIASCVVLMDKAESLNLTPINYSIAFIIYLMIIMLMAIGLMNYISKTSADKDN